MSAELRQRQVRGLRTAWLEAGNSEDPILLFLHGYPDSPESFDLQIEHFKKKYHIIAPYARGAGPSERAVTLERYGSDATALDLIEILKAVDPSGRRPVVLVGHDLGTVHAWNLAPLLGNRLQGVVLINGLCLPAMVARLGSLAQHGRSWYIYALQIPHVPEWIARRFPQQVTKLAYRMGKLPADWQPKEPSTAGCLEHSINQYRAFVREIPTTIRQRSRRLQCPVLVIWGKEDPFFAIPKTGEWEKLASRVTMRILPAGHWVHRERAAEVNRLIEKFLHA